MATKIKTLIPWIKQTNLNQIKILRAKDCYTYSKKK